MTSTARHIAVWLSINEAGLDTFEIRLVDRFMRHERHCPGWPRSGRRPGQQRRQFAIRFLRYLLETGQTEVPRRSRRADISRCSSGIPWSGTLCRHFIVWLYLLDIPLAEADDRIRNRFLAHDCACVHPGFLVRPTGFAGSGASGSMLRHFIAFLVDRDVIPAPKVVQRHAVYGEHLDAFLHWLRQHRGLRDSSIERYEWRIRTLLPALGDDPGTYDAARIRNTILDHLETASREQVGGEASAFRMYLRFLGSNGLCRPELVHAVPTIPKAPGREPATPCRAGRYRTHDRDLRRDDADGDARPGGAGTAPYGLMAAKAAKFGPEGRKPAVRDASITRSGMNCRSAASSSVENRSPPSPKRGGFLADTNYSVPIISDGALGNPSLHAARGAKSGRCAGADTDGTSEAGQIARGINAAVLRRRSRYV